MIRRLATANYLASPRAAEDRGRMLGRFHILSLVIPLAVCIACAALSRASHSGGRTLRSNFWNGSLDGDRTWTGDYLTACGGCLCFEWERIYYAAPPTTRPANRWLAEDAVGIRTPALRGLPFDGPLGFHWANFYTVAPTGSLHVTRLAFPLWAPLLPSSLPALYCTCRPFLLRRRTDAGRGFWPVFWPVTTGSVAVGEVT